MISRTMYVLFVAWMMQVSAKLAAADFVRAPAQASRLPFRIEVAAGWSQATIPGRTPCTAAKPIDCLEPGNAVLMLTPTGAGPANPAARIVVSISPGALSSGTLRAHLDRWKACFWPYASGVAGSVTNLRCLPLRGMPTGSGVASVEYPDVEARETRISLLEFRSRTDSIPLWAAAYVPAGTDVVQFTLMANSEQDYNTAMPKFREMLRSYQSVRNEGG